MAGAPPSEFTVVIPARNEAGTIAGTITAVRARPEIAEIVVVDDGSIDGTAELAEAGGATVLRRACSSGKGAALMAGADLALARDRSGGRPARRGLVFLDADVGPSAVGIGDLTRPILDDELDLAMAVYRARGDGGGHGRVVRLARRGILRRTGWRAEVPLSGVRAMTMTAYEAVRPLAAGWGVETAMTIDALRAGLRVGEVATTLTHRATGDDWRSRLHRARQYADVQRALLARASMPAPRG